MQNVLFFELENSETFGATTSFQTEESIVKTEGLFETTDTTIAQLPDVNFEGNFVWIEKSILVLRG